MCHLHIDHHHIQYVWSLVEMKHWTVQHQIVTVDLFINNTSQLQLQSVVSNSSHKVMMLLATILC
jgi:hypothetical protein